MTQFQVGGWAITYRTPVRAPLVVLTSLNSQSSLLELRTN